MTNWNIYDSLFAIVKGAAEKNAIPDEIVTKTMSICSSGVMWRLERLDESMPDKVGLLALIPNCQYWNQQKITSMDKLIISSFSESRTPFFIRSKPINDIVN